MHSYPIFPIYILVALTAITAGYLWARLSKLLAIGYIVMIFALIIGPEAYIFLYIGSFLLCWIVLGLWQVRKAIMDRLWFLLLFILFLAFMLGWVFVEESTFVGPLVASVSAIFAAWRWTKLARAGQLLRRDP